MTSIVKRATLIVRDAPGRPLRMSTVSFWDPDGYFFEINQRHAA